MRGSLHPCRCVLQTLQKVKHHMLHELIRHVMHDLLLCAWYTHITP